MLGGGSEREREFVCTACLLLNSILYFALFIIHCLSLFDLLLFPIVACLDVCSTDGFLSAFVYLFDVQNLQQTGPQRPFLHTIACYTYCHET